MVSLAVPIVIILTFVIGGAVKQTGGLIGLRIQTGARR